MSPDHTPPQDGTDPLDVTAPTSNEYWMVTATPPESAGADDIRAVLPTHLRWLGTLEDDGHLFLSGPLLSGPGVRYGSGVIVLRAADEPEATRIAAQDPLVRAGLREVVIHRWRVNEGSVSVRLSLARGTYRWG